ncbi:glycoside hydrolase family 38 C-terminal domain-containing protein [uncultured Anaerococcus sp.]|uniref:glycoside hydrolase family 38 N-terminal domain-containing protein n=1 Tax=uncultured Anaerococcus sp. TaxID=293428 RepID=UPI00288A2EDE|nr:glycoside hydrolase family 38 C-terminal domain-containing protein [uncultured Anaerococcus sp.]
MKTTIHCVMHTHWDREWYFTDNEAKILFIYHMEEVLEALESGKIDYYLLDGQMSILDDYLYFHPQNAERIKNLVINNKLAIGPWYTQVDEFLTSGESFIRNLEIGIEDSKKLGGTMNIGYLPDSFGHTKDLPKILNGFNIDKLVFWRGLYSPESKREFYWKSDDFSKVLVSNIDKGYFEGRDIVEINNENLTNGIIEYNISKSAGHNTLMPFGWDQRPVYSNIKEVLSDINKENDKFKIIESNLDNYFNRFIDEKVLLEEKTGEFMYGVVSKIHRSIYSSRYDIKMLNDYLERTMTYITEPLYLMASSKGLKNDSEIIKNIWKLIINNQAHDSLGACNSDKTNFHILARAFEAKELCDSLNDYIIRKLCISDNRINDNDIVICNTLPYKISKPLELEITTKSKNFDLYYNDKLLEYSIIEQEQKDSSNITRFKQENKEGDIYYVTNVVIMDCFEPLSFSKIKVIERVNGKEQSEISNNYDIIENEFFKISFDDQLINFKDKKSGVITKEFISFTDDGDEGDSYDYSKPYFDQVYNLEFTDCSSSIVNTRYTQSLILEGNWNVPYNLMSRKENTREKKISYRISISLDKNSKNIRFNITIDNKAKDHRIRCHINSNIDSIFHYAGTQFGYVKRDNVDKYLSKWKELNWREEPTSLYPLLNHVSISSKDQTMSVFTKGLKEYQVNDNGNIISLTLFRSVGYLGRPDLIRRPGAASGIKNRYIETPDAQLLKSMNFEFSVFISNEFCFGQIHEEYQKYVVDPLYFQKQNINKFVNPIGYFKINKNDKVVSLVKNLGYKISLDNIDASFSSIRFKDNYINLRLFNTEKAIGNNTIKLPKKLKYFFADLNGNKVGDVYFDDKVKLPNNKNAIINIFIEF